ncbi:MAG: DUF1569 domain-containing protein [Planctomycetes bacterium]|nr:DUF1569 domain-containing protein [Planctomycetota bacterium]
MANANEVNTKTVRNRRQVSYQSYDDLLADAEKLAGGDVEMVGNWTLAQVFDHLVRSFNASIDGIGFKLPWLMRVVAAPIFKHKMLNVALPSGFKIGKSSKGKFYPHEDVGLEDSLDRLRKAIERCKTERTRSMHPLFGDLSCEDWDKFSLRHAEMHMGFAVPVEK